MKPMQLLSKSAIITKLFSTKGVSWMIFLMLFGAHTLFLSTQIKGLALIISSLMILLMAIGYYAIHKRDDIKVAYRLSHHTIHQTIDFTLNDLVILASCTTGTLVVFFIIRLTELPSILVLTGLTLFVSLIKRFIKCKFFIYSDFAFYAGAFVGSTHMVIGSMNYDYIGFAGLLAGILYVLSKNVLIGVGGRLGSFAFISVYVIYTLSFLWR